jgi:hypothetical protein
MQNRMNVIQGFTLLFMLVWMASTQAQNNSKWSLERGIGIANETNLGDFGIRASTKLNRNLGKRCFLFGQIGAFQMMKSSEAYSPAQNYLNNRTLSTMNTDLGLGYKVLNKPKFQFSIHGGLSHRFGRQLWPELKKILNGAETTYYTLEKINEIGYCLGLAFDFKIFSNTWIGLDAHMHNYNYFFEYVGTGLHLKFDLK